MLAVERRNMIEKQISENGSVLVIELANRFNVTTETIRGDLYKLEKQGVLVRTYGGATIAGNGDSELNVNEREVVNSEGKQKIGSVAASMIRDGETVFLDASTSALHLSRSIKNKHVTVITNANKIVTELAECPDIHVICIGGFLNARNMSYSGRIAEETIKKNYFADKFFFSCKGVTFDHGLADTNEGEAEIKKCMLANSESAIFLCDKNKLGKIGVRMITDFSGIDFLITDIDLDEEWVKKLDENDIKLMKA